MVWSPPRLYDITISYLVSKNVYERSVPDLMMRGCCLPSLANFWVAEARAPSVAVDRARSVVYATSI